MHQSIVMLGAMNIETSFLETALVNARVREFGCFRFVEGILRNNNASKPSNQPVIVGTTGMGSVNAAAASMLAIHEYNPRCIISQGTAGAHDPALHTGDMVLGANIVNINYTSTPRTPAGAGVHPESWSYIGPSGVFENTSSDIARTTQPEGVPKNSASNAYALESDAQLLQAAQHVSYMKGARVTGAIGSGDVWNRELDRIAFFHERFGTLCEDMESYAVAQVCAGLGVPHLALRVISNSEYHAEETFDPSTAEKAQRFTLDLVGTL